MTPGALGLVTGITSIAPTVVLTSPSSGQIVAAPASITISANAADADGGIAKVEFFRDSFKIGEVTAPGPYSITYNNVQPGMLCLHRARHRHSGREHQLRVGDSNGHR